MLTRYGPLGASSRVRAYQFIPALRAAGFDVAVAPLLPDAYVQNLYAGTPVGAAFLARTYVRRIAAARAARRYDAVWIEKELLPWAPAWVEQGLLRGVPYVVDYDDAVFHTYDRHPNPVVRRTMGGKIDAVMRGAALVVVGNAYLADRAHRAGARRVEVVPSVIDLDRYTPATPDPTRPFTIGWIGSPGSERLLGSLRDVLADLTAGGLARLVLVGAEGTHLPGVVFEPRPWSEASEVDEIRTFDVGIMPLPDEPWTRGKCGYKLIQYMGAALPVVASPVGVNTEIIDDGMNGFLAATPEAWKAALRTLRDDPVRARAMGERGRRRVEDRYSLAVAAPRLVGLLRSFTD